jgi:hypothetical protein
MANKAWAGAGKRALARSAVQKTVASSLLTSYKKVKRKPEDFYNVGWGREVCRGLDPRLTQFFSRPKYYFLTLSPNTRTHVKNTGALGEQHDALHQG